MDHDIVFSIGKCILGTVLVGSRERGACAILLGDDRLELVRDLRKRFPGTGVREADRELAPLLSKVVALIADPASPPAISLDLQGSMFQQRVWKALQEIPAGSTETYGAIARRIGAPQSAKEVGEACAANPIAVAIPCHRVVRKDGGLAGYRWGVRRKRALLELEKR
jgi:AraC family transcriptional regulator, regulatory protein of adaptative response / methylated-DNA-[protein]-cysteine methyltransferase